MRISWLSAAVMLVCAEATAQTSTTVLEAVSDRGQIDSSTQTDDVGFKEDTHDRMTVDVRLSGTGPYRFLVDTGADRTAISRELASKLRLAPGGTAEMHSISGASMVQTAELPQIEFSRKVIQGIEAPLLDRENMGADGILGADSLRSQRVLFDFKNQTMSIVPSATVSPAEDKNTIVVKGRLKNGRLILTNATAEKERLSVIVDTGSEVTIGNNALRNRLAGRGVLRSLGPLEIVSVTGQRIVGDYMFLKRLEIGGVTLENLAIVFADVHTFKQLKLDNKPAALLGMNAIRAFEKVSIDFATRKLRVVLPQQSSRGELRVASGPARGSALVSPAGFEPATY